MNKKYDNLTKEFVYQKYCIEDKNLKDIANEVGCTVTRVHQIVKEHKLYKQKKDPYIGKKFGKLLVIEYINKYRKNKKYRCLCDCGKEKIFIGYNLLKGDNEKSCGCTFKKARRDYSLKNGYGEITGTLWGRIKNNAVCRNIEFNITPEEAWDIYLKQDKKCYYTNKPIYFPKDSASYRNGNCDISLDRKNNNIGYIKDNVQWVYKKVNMMKNNLAEEEFINICKDIYEHSFRNNDRLQQMFSS